MRNGNYLYRQFVFALLVLLLGMVLPAPTRADDPNKTVRVMTGSWQPEVANVGDTITSNATASDSNAPQPQQEHTITPHWLWTTVAVYTSDTGVSGTFTPYTGNYVIGWPTSDDTQPSVKFNGVFLSPGYFIVMVHVTVTYHDDTSNTVVHTSYGDGYLGGSASDIAGASGTANALQAHQTAADGSSTKGIPVLNGFHYIADPQISETPFKKAPVNLKTGSYSNIKVFAGDTIVLLFSPVNPDQDKRQKKNSSGNYASSDYETVAGTGSYSVIVDILGGGTGVILPNATSHQVFSGTSANPTVLVRSYWKKQPFSITMTFHDTGLLPQPQVDDGNPGDDDASNTWDFVAGSTSPTKLTQVSSTPPAGQYATAPATYTYLAGADAPPAYSGDSIDETFGTPTAGFSLSDVTNEFKQQNPSLANSANSIALAVFGSGGAKTSFVIDDNNNFSDTHGGNDNFPAGTYNQPPVGIMVFTAKALASGVVWNLPQTYSCAGNTIGSCVISRKLVGQFQLSSPNDATKDGEGTYTPGSVSVSKTAP